MSGAWTIIGAVGVSVAGADGIIGAGMAGSSEGGDGAGDGDSVGDACSLGGSLFTAVGRDSVMKALEALQALRLLSLMALTFQ